MPAGKEFQDELVSLLEANALAWLSLTSWSEVADYLSAHRERLMARGQVPADHVGREGVLRWAGGEQAAGAALIERCYGPAREQALLADLADRFQVSQPS